MYTPIKRGRMLQLYDDFCDISMYIRIHARMRGARGHAVE